MKDLQNDTIARERKRQRQRERRTAYKTGDREPQRVRSTITQAYMSGDKNALLREIKLRTRWHDSCWIWTGWINSSGRPFLNLGPHQTSVRKLVAETFMSPFDKKSKVFVTCGQKLCLNPEHLYIKS